MTIKGLASFAARRLLRVKRRKNKTLYICWHCKKEMKTLGGLIKHEMKCNLNPLNRSFCQHCGKCEKETHNQRSIIHE